MDAQERKLAGRLAALLKDDQKALKQQRIAYRISGFLFWLIVIGVTVVQSGSGWSFFGPLLLGIALGLCLAIGGYSQATLKQWPVLKKFLNPEVVNAANKQP